ncbi:uncharacterized protein OCT59_008549 [Rhizophagus irregularis]|uniref:uncharacterized protein n=1 Tax=Rhizophagus irregularis TaxID=588596 RepID=UPI00332CE6E1|nr:hypothetical protein OCT59_008549 [Rhizophagus irregularis]
MLRNIGCHDVTPFSKQDSKYEFWTRSLNHNIEKNVLKQLYEFGFLMSQPVNFYDDTTVSIIANDFKYEELQKQLSVSNDLISKARIHCHLNGPGGSSMKKPSFTREKLPSEKLQEFEKFINDKAHVVISSYKTDSKTGAPIKYLRDTKQALWEKFHAKFPNGIHRTTFMTKLQGNEYIYREDLGRLCSTCSRYGYEIFVDIRKLIENKFIDSVKKRDYEKNLIVNNKGITEHNPCISYCLLWAFGVCTEQHTHASQECAKLFTFFNRLKNQLSTDLHEDLDEYQNHLLYYLAHQVRKVYLNAQFNANLLDLDENGAVLVVDYKMKILPKSARETKAEFFGKKASSLHAVIESLENKPKWITIISDNGPHYHNADLMMILGNWLEWYQINVKKWIFLEAGKAKTTIDSHHAQITHAIKRQVRLGLDIMEGADIETAIRDICRTSVAHLEPNRTKDQNKRAKNTLPGNSNLFEWTWPGEGSMAGYILEPTSSTHTTPKNEWVIAMPNISGIDPKRLTRERLLFELKKRNINVINTAKRDGLVKELELGLANETEMIQDDISENQENQNIIW